MANGKRRTFSLRMDAELLAKVEQHRKALEAQAPSAVAVSLRAALEDLLLKAIKAEVQG
jgi:hypothetical protein